MKPPPPSDYPTVPKASPEQVNFQISQVTEFDGPNYCNAHVPCQSTLNISAWRKYEPIISQKDSILVDQLEFGFTICINHDTDINILITNHQSARAEPHGIDKIINKHYNQGSLLGPYKTSPLPVPLYPSLLQVVTSASGKKRADIDTQLIGVSMPQFPGSGQTYMVLMVF